MCVCVCVCVFERVRARARGWQLSELHRQKVEEAKREEIQRIKQTVLSESRAMEHKVRWEGNSQP